MKIAVACAKCAFSLKEAIKAHLIGLGNEVIDFSPDINADWYYPEPFHAGAKAIQEGKAEIGIFCCGTGMGASITANKHTGVYASVVESIYSAQRCKMINNANVLCIGNFIVGEGMALEMVDAYLNATFTEGPGLNPELLRHCEGLIHGYEAEQTR